MRFIRKKVIFNVEHKKFSSNLHDIKNNLKNKVLLYSAFKRMLCLRNKPIKDKTIVCKLI